MMTKRVEFREVAEGATFSAEYGEHGQKRATFRKTAFNMGRCLDGDWPMPFLVDEKVDIVCPNATAHVRAVASNVDPVVGCPFCGVMKRGHSLRCHVQACSARNKPTGGKDALGMVDNVRTAGGGNRRVGRVRMAKQPVRPVLQVTANAQNEARQLGRWDACPAGNQLQPGCPICHTCQYHIGTEWNNGGMYGYHLTDCNMPNVTAHGGDGRSLP